MKSVDLAPFRHLYPFKSHFAKINGFNYHYLDEGAGDAVVMVHGNPTWSFYFRELIKALSPYHRVFAVDHIGCGLSDKPDADRYPYRLQNRIDDLDAFLEQVYPKGPLTFVVHDWGGAIGLAVALNQIDRVRRLVVLNTAAFFPPSGKPLPWQLKVIRNLPPFATLAVKGFNLFARGAAVMAAHKKLAPDVKSGLTAPYNSWHNRTATLKFVQDIPLGPGDPSYAPVRQLDDGLHRFSDLPILLSWGLRDFVFDADYLSEWQRRFPNAEAHAWEDAGHYVLEDQPGRVCDLVKTFFENHPV